MGGHIIDNELIVRGDKSKPRLDLNFEIYGNLVVVEGLNDCIQEWNSRFKFDEYTEQEGCALKEQYIEESNQYHDI